MRPDNIIADGKIILLISDHKFGAVCHVFADRIIHLYMTDAVIPACKHAEKFSVRCSVIRNRHRAVSGLLQNLKHFRDRRIRFDICIGNNITGFVVLYTGNHGSL